LAILFVIFYPELFNPPHPGMSITKINESIIPDGPIVHVVDEDLDEYPSLARAIRENSQQGYSRQNGTRIKYYIGLSWQEYNRILGSKFFSHHNTFFEFDGTYYSFVHS